MWSKSSYTVCIAKVWFMCDSPAFFCVCVAKDGGVVRWLEYWSWHRACTVGGVGKSWIWRLRDAYNSFTLSCLWSFLLKSNVSSVVSWRRCSLWATYIHEFLWFFILWCSRGIPGSREKRNTLSIYPDESLFAPPSTSRKTNWTKHPSPQLALTEHFAQRALAELLPRFQMNSLHFGPCQFGTHHQPEIAPPGLICVSSLSRTRGCFNVKLSV